VGVTDPSTSHGALQEAFPFFDAIRWEKQPDEILRESKVKALIGYHYVNRDGWTAQ